MYAAAYPLHHPLRDMDPRSRIADDHYPHPPPAWQMLPQQHYPDLPAPVHPQPGPSAHVPSPLSTPSNGGDNSPVEYFNMHNMSHGPQEQWAMPPTHQGAPPARL